MCVGNEKADRLYRFRLISQKRPIVFVVSVVKNVLPRTSLTSSLRLPLSRKRLLPRHASRLVRDECLPTWK